MYKHTHAHIYGGWRSEFAGVEKLDSKTKFNSAILLLEKVLLGLSLHFLINQLYLKTTVLTVITCYVLRIVLNLLQGCVKRSYCHQ